MQAKFTRVIYLVSGTYITSSQASHEAHDSSPQPRASDGQCAVGCAHPGGRGGPCSTAHAMRRTPARAPGLRGCEAGRGGGAGPTSQGTLPARSSPTWPCSWGHGTNCSQEQFSYSCRCACPEPAAGPHEPLGALPRGQRPLAPGQGRPSRRPRSSPEGEEQQGQRNSRRHCPEEAVTAAHCDRIGSPIPPTQASQSNPAGEDTEPSGAGRGEEAPGIGPGTPRPAGCARTSPRSLSLPPRLPPP